MAALCDTAGVVLRDTAGGVLFDTAGIALMVPDAILASANLTGAVAVIDEPVDTPDASWLTATVATAATDLRVSFPTPAVPPSVGVGLQTFRLWLRKTAGATDPTVDVELWEAGSFVANLLNDVAITSTTGQLVEVSWNASLLSGGDGAGVECRVVSTPGATGFNPAPVATVWSHPTAGATISGGVFSQWDDATGNGNHWVMSTADRQPAEATVNGIRVLDFDGLAAPNGDYMTGDANVSTIWTSNVDEDLEATLVCKVDTSTSGRFLWYFPSGATGNVRLIALSEVSNRLSMSYRTNAGGTATSPTGASNSFSTGVWRYIRVIKDGGNLSFYLNGTLYVTAATDARVLVVASADGNGNAPIGLGARSEGASSFDGQIADVAVYKTLLTTEQRADDDARLAALVAALSA
jgi:hypothetical protein